MNKISQEKLQAYKYKGRVIERYAKILEELDLKDLKLMLDEECKCHDPDFAYFEGLEEVIGCHKIWFDRIRESSLKDIVTKHSSLKEDEEGSYMESQIKVYTTNQELLFDFLVVHNDISISSVILMGGNFFQTIKNYRPKDK